MKTKLNESSLCEFVNNLSIEVYFQLSRFFSYKLGMAEIGITDILLLELIDFSNKTKSAYSFEIYKTNSKREAIYGNDIDLFIQGEDGFYVWFAFQAKVMSHDGVYKDLVKKKKRNQWNKLMEHQRKYKSKTYYLLYNGDYLKLKKDTSLISDCKCKLELKNLGLGIVETKEVKKRMNKKPVGKVSMHDFLPINMHSLRKLFCCDPINVEKAYTYEEIYKNAPYDLIPLTESTKSQADILFESNFDSTKIEEEFGIAPNRIIISNTK